ncbi:MAG TPA: helix-turn-helix domain-containing protein, partial [Labilithrix sp.]
REDLFYRLAVVRVRLPPLRERPEDVEPIAARLAATLGIGALPTALVAKLRARSWPGNVRELRNVLQAYAVLGDLAELASATPRGDSLADMVDVRRPYLELKEEIVARFTRLYLEAILEQTGGNQAEAARLSGLDRTYLGRLLQKYPIER